MTAMLPMVFGPPPEHIKPVPPVAERWRNRTMLAPALVLLALALALGAYQPAFVRDALTQAAATLTTPAGGTGVAVAHATEITP
jgi:hypothetical protein